ncbi:acetylxylan esterase [Streptomyces sp. NPDC026673]|uniref:acetylxylan esterase n=1 Tax=Streptomyces sp. NPDC026673 TaxID=3155724 RepID=UPI0033C8CA28
MATPSHDGRTTGRRSNAVGTPSRETIRYRAYHPPTCSSTNRGAPPRRSPSPGTSTPSGPGRRPPTADREAGTEPAEYRPVDSPLAAVDVLDVRSPGWGGQPTVTWLSLPRGAAVPLPGVVTCVGYDGGRGQHHEQLLWSAAG